MVKGEIDPEQPFNLNLTLECGSRSSLEAVDGTDWWSSVFDDYVIRIRQECRTDAPLEYESMEDRETVEDTLRWQFRLQDDDEDIRVAYAHLECDLQIEPLVHHYSGLRVMRVDSWECLAFLHVGQWRFHQYRKGHYGYHRHEFDESVEPDESERHQFPTLDVVASQQGLDRLKVMYLEKGPLLHEAAQSHPCKMDAINWLSHIV